MNWFVVILAVILIWRVAEGLHAGMVKEIISFVSLIVMSVAVVLLGVALSSYMEKAIIKMIVVIILFLILCIVHRVLNLFFFSAKMIAKLPMVNLLDRLLGGVVGFLETILIFWVVCSLIISFGLGEIGQQILLYIQRSPFLTFLYEHNYLAYGVNLLSQKLSIFPINMEDITAAAGNVGDIIQENVEGILESTISGNGIE